MGIFKHKILDGFAILALMIAMVFSFAGAVQGFGAGSRGGGGGAAGAPTDATYIVQTANSTLSAEQAMGSLATGIVKNTTTTGTQSIAVAGTDYPGLATANVFNAAQRVNGTVTLSDAAGTGDGTISPISGKVIYATALGTDKRALRVKSTVQDLSGKEPGLSVENASNANDQLQLGCAGGSTYIQSIIVGSSYTELKVNTGGTTFSEGAGNVTCVSVVGQMAARGIILPAQSPAQITGNQDNYSLGNASVNHYYLVRLSSDASRNITGFVTTNPVHTDGQSHLIVNVGAQDIVLKHLTTSTAANQIQCSTGADITLTAGQACDIIYDGTTTKWRAFKRN